MHFWFAWLCGAGSGEPHRPLAEVCLRKPPFRQKIRCNFSVSMGSQTHSSGASGIAKLEGARKPANPLPTLRQPFANPSPTFRQLFQPFLQNPSPSLSFRGPQALVWKHILTHDLGESEKHLRQTIARKMELDADLKPFKNEPSFMKECFYGSTPSCWLEAAYAVYIRIKIQPAPTHDIPLQ